MPTQPGVCRREEQALQAQETLWALQTWEQLCRELTSRQSWAFVEASHQGLLVPMLLGVQEPWVYVNKHCGAVACGVMRGRSGTGFPSSAHWILLMCVYGGRHIPQAVRGSAEILTGKAGHGPKNLGKNNKMDEKLTAFCYCASSSKQSQL